MMKQTFVPSPTNRILIKEIERWMSALWYWQLIERSRNQSLRIIVPRTTDTPRRQKHSAAGKAILRVYLLWRDAIFSWAKNQFPDLFADPTPIEFKGFCWIMSEHLFSRDELGAQILMDPFWDQFPYLLCGPDLRISALCILLHADLHQAISPTPRDITTLLAWAFLDAGVVPFNACWNETAPNPGLGLGLDPAIPLGRLSQHRTLWGHPLRIEHMGRLHTRGRLGSGKGFQIDISNILSGITYLKDESTSPTAPTATSINTQ